jgi:hypothetical protein
VLLKSQSRNQVYNTVVLAGERKTSDGIVQSEIRDMRRRFRDRKGLALMGAAKGAGALFGPLGTGLSLAHDLKKGSASAMSARAVSATLLANDSDPRTLEVLRVAFERHGLERPAGSCDSPGEDRPLTVCVGPRSFAARRQTRSPLCSRCRNDQANLEEDARCAIRCSAVKAGCLGEGNATQFWHVG